MKTTMITAAVFAAAMCAEAFAATPGTINFQGRLLDSSLLPRNGSFAASFRICDSLSGSCAGGCAVGNPCLWTESKTLNVANGVFAVQLGSTTPIAPDVFSAATRYLEITVGAETLSPREPLAGSAYSFRSSVADSLAPAAAYTLIGNNTAGAAAPLALSTGVVKAAIGLDNVTNDAQVKAADVGAANGVAPLDASSLVTAAYGGTGNGFTKFSGPAAAEKTFTLPNASAMVLTDAAAVTIAQGGTGQTTKTAAMDALAPTSSKGDIMADNGTDVVALPVGANNLTLTADSTQATGLKWSVPYITSYSSAAGGDFTMTTAGTWYRAAALSLPAGTYLVNALITLGKAAATADVMYARIFAVTANTSYVSGQAHNPAVNPHATTITLCDVITLGSADTLGVYGTSSVASALIKGALTANGVGNNATQISAIRLY